MLTHANLNVYATDLGEEGVDLAKLYDYDLILLDLGLPDGDGLDLCRDLRRSGRSVPIIILTAKDSVDDKVVGLDSGADDYLVKPFAPAELVARVRALLRREVNVNRLTLGDVRFGATDGLLVPEIEITGFAVDRPADFRLDLGPYGEVQGAFTWRPEISDVDLRLAWGGFLFPRLSLAAHAAYDAAGLWIDALDADLDGQRVTGQGCYRVDDGSGLQLDLLAQRLDLDALDLALPEPGQGDGGARPALRLRLSADSLGSLNVWEISRYRSDLSVKDLMVRPYLQRFLREGDSARIAVAVNNAADSDLLGEVTVRLYDPDPQGLEAGEAAAAEAGSASAAAEPRGCCSRTPPARAATSVATLPISRHSWRVSTSSVSGSVSTPAMPTPQDTISLVLKVMSGS